MTALNDRFWAKVLFKEFIKHYRKMTDEQIIADIHQSMDDLEDLVDTSASFGSKMVRWSMDRVDQYPQASENGKKGGRPRKNQETTADASEGDGEVNPDGQQATQAESGTSANHYGPRQANNGVAPHREAVDVSATDSKNSEARQGQRAGGNSVRRVAKVNAPPARSAGPMPENKQAVYDFAAAEGLDTADAYECWHVTVNERDGLTADGKPVKNWKAYVRKWCETRASRRNQ